MQCCLDGTLSLPQAAKGRFVAVNSEPPLPGIGREKPAALSATANEYSRL